MGAALLLLVLGAASCGAGSTAPQTYSAAALYNRGNAEARAGRPALAVLNYARARILAPRDADIRSNLQAVRRSAGLPEPTDGGFIDHARFASPDTVYWWGVVGLLLASGALLARRRFPRRPALAVLCALGLVMVLMSAGDVIATRSLLRQSVVLRAAAARASPVRASDPLFTLPAAELVRVEECHQDFALVRDPDGRQGWTALEDLLPVVPADGGR